MMYLKVTNYGGSRIKISMCKIENAAVGTKLHPPPGIGLIELTCSAVLRLDTVINRISLDLSRTSDLYNF